MLYDDDALYIAARLYDTDPELITARICVRTTTSARTIGSTSRSIRSTTAAAAISSA
jgi:hypothetical protein